MQISRSPSRLQHGWAGVALLVLVVVSHDLASIFKTADRALFLDIEEKTMTALGPPVDLRERADGAVGLAKLARQTEIAVTDLTGAFTALGAELGLDWAQATAALMSPSDVWERLLVGGLARDFQQMRFDFLRRLARRKGAKEDMPAMIEKWVSENAAGVRAFRTMIGRAQAQSPVAPAMLAQIASMARNLLGK